MGKASQLSNSTIIIVGNGISKFDFYNPRPIELHLTTCVRIFVEINLLGGLLEEIWVDIVNYVWK